MLVEVTVDHPSAGMAKEKLQVIREADLDQEHHHRENTKLVDTQGAVAVQGHIRPEIGAGRDLGVPTGPNNAVQELGTNHYKVDVWEFSV